MSFPQDVRTKALVSAARHCCVCHRYKGLKVEVHHIIQEADGGPNTLDNAITLCADCHTDAGHYNVRHPRGTKFSPQELRSARDTWHDIVRSGSVSTPGSTELLYCRYLVCKSFDAVREIVCGDLSEFPVKNSSLARTPVFDFLSTVVSGCGQFRVSSLSGSSFQTEEDYVRKHPDAAKTSDTISYGQRWLTYERKPTLDELREKIATKDYISEMALNAGQQPEVVCKVIASTEGCGGGVLLQEHYLLRSFWVVYLVITNDSEHRIRLVGLDAQLGGIGAKAPPVNINGPLDKQPHTTTLPVAEVPPKATIVLPIATLLGPLGGGSEELTWTDEHSVTNGQKQKFSHASFPSIDIDQFYFLGPVLHSPQLRYMLDGIERIQQIHEIDLKNLYLLDRYWQMGSCPHLFSIGHDGTVRYEGEIFSSYPGMSQVDTFAVEKHTKALVLAELEEETTFVNSILQGGIVLAENVLLEKGDCLIISIAGLDAVTIAGQYEL